MNKRMSFKLLSFSFVILVAFSSGCSTEMDPPDVGAKTPNGVIDSPATDQKILTGESVNFTGTATDPEGNAPLTFLWDFGGGASNASVEDPGLVTFDTPGVYSVTFTVTNSTGLSDPTPDTRTITVNDTALSGGSLAWAKRVGGINGDFGIDIASFSDGSSVVIGFYNGTSGPVTFGLGESNETRLEESGPGLGFDDAFITRYNIDGTLAWAKRIGGPFTSVTGIASFSNGSSVVAGSFSGSPTFGVGEVNETILVATGFSGDTFIARYDANGMLAWAKQAGGGSFTSSGGIASFSDESSVVTGTFSGSASFGSGEVNETILVSKAGSNAVFIARYNGDGTLAWAKQVGGLGVNVGIGIASFSDGSSVVTGVFSGSATFGVGETNETILTAESAERPFIARYNTDGTLVWAKRVRGGNFDLGGIASFSGGSSVVAGSFDVSATFGLGEANETILVATGSENAFIARYNVDGTLAWAKQEGGVGGTGFFSDIATFLDGSSIGTGVFSGVVILGAGEANEKNLISAGSEDIFIALYKADGTLTWVKQAGGVGSDRGQGIATFSDGSSVGTGKFTGVATFGAGEANETILTSAGLEDVFIGKFSP